MITVASDIFPMTWEPQRRAMTALPSHLHQPCLSAREPGKGIFQLDILPRVLLQTEEMRMYICQVLLVLITWSMTSYSLNCKYTHVFMPCYVWKDIYQCISDWSLDGGISGYFYFLAHSYIDFFTINIVIITKILQMH